ncbi:hypothetical protein [Staphylococcus edaphicus]|uniref:DUF4870 domain-containing protein n=1 Tax=Staphylococcus edaphicus TaxID=1955013 RepID=A0A2C6WCH1_9STAP|nr:hypothetical protein [Staphylococcus edaphicus]PHK48568.1 hypothetical protein BTJ66_12935 [Staphylococcus edaphicus]UQW81447.1 hypothetical protein MNY58_12960 [Staphylococcus edaphicus]
MENSNNQNVLSSLNYFSVFFAPLLFPIIVWICATKPATSHAKKALLNHIGITIFYFLSSAAFIFSQEVYRKPFDHPTTISNVSLALGLLFGLCIIILFIINLVRGIKLLLR